MAGMSTQDRLHEARLAMNSRISDWLLALTLSGIGFALGYRALLDFGSTNIDQDWMSAAVMWACGYGLVDPASKPTTLVTFLKMGALSFDCRDLASVGQLDHPSAAFDSHIYLGLAAAVSWRLLGVSYLSLGPLLGAFY